MYVRSFFLKADTTARLFLGRRETYAATGFILAGRLETNAAANLLLLGVRLETDTAAALLLGGRQEAYALGGGDRLPLEGGQLGVWRGFCPTSTVTVA